MKAYLKHQSRRYLLRLSANSIEPLLVPNAATFS